MIGKIWDMGMYVDHCSFVEFLNELFFVHLNSNKNYLINCADIDLFTVEIEVCPKTFLCRCIKHLYLNLSSLW